MSNTSKGRAALSMHHDELAWLDQLLATAARGGDLRVMMRSPISSRVLRIVGSAKDRAHKTAEGHMRPLRHTTVRRVLIDLEQNGPATAGEIHARIGGSRGAVGSALWWNKGQGRVTYDRVLKRWSYVTAMLQPFRPVVASAGGGR